METLLGLALKSLLIAGATLILLHLTAKRSASDRSWIAHLGLFALVALPLGSLALPALHVPLPAAWTQSVETIAPIEAIAPAASRLPSVAAADRPAVAGPVSSADGLAATPSFNSEAWAPYAYALPVVVLLAITLLALLRLFALRHRAQVLVDPVWLSALAHAQRRMGFKNGTALLTSSELSSPISWGLMRPVILLNDAALEASGEAEAIIAHELAHVARLDWAKMMLARVATSIFWFNPLAWVLAREAHQLREEAADDAVLAADISDTDYAQLLVGVARHECKGLLLGAHGISPGKDSLRRRVSRVLDGTLARGPAQRSWLAGLAVGMLVMAAPLAALTFAPNDDLPAQSARSMDFAQSSVPNTAGATGVVVAGGTSAAAITPAIAATTAIDAHDPSASAVSIREDGGQNVELVAGADGVTINVDGKRPVRIRTASGGDPIDDAISMKIHGVTPEYVAAISAAAPQLANIDSETLVGMKIHGITPALVRELNSNYRGVDAQSVTASGVHHITPEYARAMARAGYAGVPLDKLVTMKIHGVTPDYVARFKRAGYRAISADEIVNLKIQGADPDGYKIDASDP